MEADDMTESPRKTGRNLENIPSHVKKRLSKIIEDENGDEDGAQPRPEKVNVRLRSEAQRMLVESSSIRSIGASAPKRKLSSICSSGCIVFRAR